ncbi:MAG: hypothetical protein R3F61_39205 [Myxococcota bacterium]
MPEMKTGAGYRANERASARREPREGNASWDDEEDEADDAFTDEVACAVCGESFPSNQMFFGENGQVCAAHFEG